jgi:L-gulono-1,4-lactone dehydrogenase
MWANWAGDQTCRPAVVERPAGTAEVQAAVRHAAATGRTVRVAGAGHSFSDAAATDGALLTLERMERVVDADPASGLVRVQAGITLHDLNRRLLELGLALPNLGDIDVQHVGGAIATGTHGTGATKGNLSVQVVAAQVVDGHGEVREIEGGDLLRAVRVSTGSLGVITELTLRCVPAFRLEGIDDREPLEEVLATLDERVDGNPHFEFWTFPHSRWALTRTNRPTEAPPDGPPSWRLRAGQIWLDNHLFEALLRTGRRVPPAIPALNRLAGRLTGRRRRVADSFEIFASPRLFRFTETEQAIPREHAAEALLLAREVCERHAVGIPIECRFVAADDALLSPSHGRATAYIAAHVYVGMDFEPALREVEQALGRFGARPHWGKRSWLTHAELAPRYPRWVDFQAARAELDPDGRFANAYARRVLGPLA